MIAWSNASIGQPASGVTYAPGETLPGGGVVLYAGSLNQYTHSGLASSTTYNYKAFSYTNAMAYSEGTDASATTPSAPPTLSVSPTNIDVSDVAGSTAFIVTSNSEWTAETQADWCIVTSSGIGNGPVEVVYEANLLVSQRIAEITVTVAGLNPVTVTLAQSGATPVLSVLPETFSVPAAAGNVQAVVTSNTSWNAVSSNPEWCTVTPSGSGNGILSIDYTLNTWAAVRTASITLSAEGVSPVIITLAQEAAEAYLTLDPSTIQVPGTSGTTLINVTANFDWMAGSDSPWCEVVPQVGSGNAVLVLNYDLNTTTVERTAIISVVGSPMTISATLIQEAGAATLEVSPLNALVSNEAGSVEFTVASNVDWTAEADSAWLSVTQSGSGSGILTAGYAANPYSGSRTSIIMVTGEGLTPFAVSVTQYGTGVGIDENELNSLRIYPNPAKDEFIVEVNPSEYPEFNIQLLNLAGLEILSKQCSGKEKYSVDISSVKSGSYMIRIKSGEKMINRIILIMK
jgi:hypothetical protein